jgi:hypothetical protein
MKKVILALLMFLCFLTGIVNATWYIDEYGTYHSYNELTNHKFEWTNATKDANCSLSASHCNQLRYIGTAKMDFEFRYPLTHTYSSKVTAYPNDATWRWYYLHHSEHYAFVENDNIQVLTIFEGTGGQHYHGNANNWRFTATFYDPNDTLLLSGETACVNNIRVYINVSGEYYNYSYKDLNASDSYSFYISDNSNYKLIFSDDHEYEFTTTGENIIYDHDDCTHTIYRFEESCGNLIPDSEGFYCEWTDIMTCNCFKESNGILEILNSSANKIDIYTNTFIGQIKWIIDPVVSDTTYVVKNPNIAWGLKVIVQNESDGTLIDGVMVKVDQGCYCTDDYSTRQKLTVNGMVSFGDMSLQDASLWVMASGYKILDENSTNYSAFLSGKSNFSSKNWIVKLAPSWSENSSTWYESKNKVDIHFRNEDGNRTSKILDTDSEVYLYYENNNSNKEAMTLKFQSSSTHTHFIDEQSWSIAYDDIGHKTIANSYFTPYNYAYRAVIYNSSIYGWNMTIPLTVRNATKEESQHYENLSTNLWFLFEKDGKIDYRNDMEIVTHARSNNITLMNIDLEIWKDGVLLCYKNLTETDYAGASFPYYYVYEPIYNYVSGSNYTAKMYGFDRTLLEIRYLKCMTDDTTRKNKLTIIVKNQYGTNLDNCYIYLEGWGSLPTGSTYYNSYEGLDNGYYRYKATKPNYVGTGWSDITISDSDEIVTYVLTATDSDDGAAQTKMDDANLSNLYLMVMAVVLMIILFGGFKYAM